MNEIRQNREKKYFDNLAESNQEIWWGNKTVAGKIRKERRAKLLVDFLSQFKSPRVLEIGCGAGFFSQIFLQHAKPLDFIGLDISPKSIDIAKAKCKNFKSANFVVGDITQLKFSNNSFDAVIGVSILHHVPLTSGLKEIYRVLKHKGVIWFSEPNMMNLEVLIQKKIHFIGRLLENSDDETAFYRWPLFASLNQIGFTDVIVKPFDFLHPLTPPFLIPIVNSMGEIVEKIPLLKEISGSLLIMAMKP